MYLILTASKDNYITNKIISNGPAFSKRSVATLNFGGAMDSNTKITITSTDLLAKTFLVIQNGHGSIANGDLIEIGDTPEGPDTAASGEVAISGGTVAVNAKITLVSTDTTSLTYIGATEGGSVATGKSLAIGDDPDGEGNIVGGDPRIGMIAFQVGTNAASGANNIQTAINSAAGHNSGTPNSKISISNDGAGKLALTQVTVGSSGNTNIVEAGDSTNVITVTNFSGGNTYTAIVGGDERIGMTAIHAGNSAGTAANNTQTAINSANGNNLGESDSKIIIANNGAGSLVMTQAVAGESGNQRIVITSDTNNVITLADEGFTGGKTAAPIRATDANVGQAGTLDIFKLYGENTIAGNEDDLIELSRALIKFDHDAIISHLSKSLDINSDNFKAEIRLRDITTGRAAPSNFTLMALPLSKSFDEGIGRSVSTFNDLDIANFVTASFVGSQPVLWNVEGANATGSAPGNWDALTAVQTRSPYVGAPNSDPANSPTTVNLKSTFTAVRGDEDVVFDVTNAVSATLKSDIANHGFRISFEESEENNKQTYFIKRLGSRHVRNIDLRPELHIFWNDSQVDSLENAEFDLDNNVYLKNYKKGVPKNLRSGTVGGDPVTTTMSDIAGGNCMKLILSKSELKKTYNVSQVLKGTDNTGEEGNYTASFNIDLFSNDVLASSKSGSTTITFLGGPLDLNTKITFASTDGTSKSYLAITEDHGSIANGDLIQVGDNPDGSGAIIAGDERIGSVAFMAGSSNVDAANSFAAVIDLANGHNAGNANSKITIANNSKGVVTLTQTTAGELGNRSINVVGDNSRRLRFTRNFYKFTGGSDSKTVEKEARASGSITFDAFWKSNDESVTYHKTKIEVRNSSVGPHGHGAQTPSITMSNLKSLYSQKDEVRIRVFPFDMNEDFRNPVKIPHSRKPSYVGEIYWRLVNETTGRVMIDYEKIVGSTKLSFDKEGYYFDFSMSVPPPGATCRFEFCRENQGKAQIMTQRRFARFRVIK